MVRLQLFAALLFCAGASAFMGPLAPRTVLCAGTLSPRSTSPVMMSNTADTPSITITEIEALAQGCIDGECSVETVNELMDGLNKKKQELVTQLSNVETIIASMKALSSKEEPGEFMKLVEAIKRVFTMNDDDFPALSEPMGFSGDIPKGGVKTAWDYKIDSGSYKPMKK